MSEGVKITSFELENIKRVKAVSLTVEGKSLVCIGGDNGKGKTSILDGIAYALGGERMRPENVHREGSEESSIRIVMSNGVVVERDGKNMTLKVTDETGKKAGQELLTEFVSQFALTLPTFLNASDKNRANILLDSMPDLAKKLRQMNDEHDAMYKERHDIGVIADRAKKYAESLPHNDDVPESVLSGSDMAAKLTEALSVNAKNAELRRRAVQTKNGLEEAKRRFAQAQKRVNELTEALNDAKLEEISCTNRVKEMEAAVANTMEAAGNAKDEDITSIKAELEKIDSINAAIRANEERHLANIRAEEEGEKYRALDEKINDLKKRRVALLSDTEWPLESMGMTEEGTITFKGQPWSCTSSSERLRIATAIAGKIKPKCRFVLLDKLEQFDVQTLADFSEWLAENDMQVIGTRVSTGPENTVIIEDGMIQAESKPTTKKAYKF